MNTADIPIRLGISSCLLGQEVRYDGGHKRNQYILEMIGPLVSWVPLCPEVEIDLGVPRPPIQLEGNPTSPRLIMPSTGMDLTERMERFARKRVRGLQQLGLDGFILKSRSPSCGPEEIPVWHVENPVSKSGVGAFARILGEMCPDLPIENEVDLEKPELCEQFIEQVSLHRQRRVNHGAT